ncbi:YceD family protein [Sphingobacterium spiritivorum]|uniref:ACR, COG1399 n=1 Tax=Sphingobacterium spiritivorum ATCC 33861 TaxID=525373 RepID=D7VMS0_SPHSI|nr:DUF177 domain-containing protein [Sphingobacterium spiritivorum]EFK57217.1 putative ACR, COG1399 [Sphingobacterium spiritivorum ATCC 33861]QQT36693.1 DUF177 domain-containing protein [Sphingobacterium spiritivorum]WQD33445.1 DUF177 domain-containing protein [Sphingobacterium spiritivorum]SUJ23445.1 Uncharacterized ACR, COG1399 [Sphingobacterium spiritivorum]
MKYLKQYRIPFSGLNAGKHSFDFDIEKKFFDCFEHSIVKDGNLKAQVDLQKQENMLIVHFTITGTIKLTCDVCLSEFDYPIDVKERILVKFTDENWEEDTEEVIVLSKNDYEFDIAHLLYEYINVAVPYYTKCSEQGLNQSCDPEMLAKVNQTEEEEENSAEEHIDPRWSALRNIKNN